MASFPNKTKDPWRGGRIRDSDIRKYVTADIKKSKEGWKRQADDLEMTTREEAVWGTIYRDIKRPI